MSNPNERTHGHVATYNSGCRCAECREASSVYMKKYRRRVKDNGGKVLGHHRGTESRPIVKTAARGTSPSLSSALTREEYLALNEADPIQRVSPRRYRGRGAGSGV